ncbi:uncharacterized protein I303_101211 [Kwoniella dejecticola CBS 10117]|uniref:Uncharacterized protein n=1 Tax=Kwoniella dejecticola CBS 10117 TaxID=1296121 RepID=A0A1A6AH30_9TREE|nr:uncharacterized protein I303_01217 [Kwoniella dejecticola CBS 10117]OBR89390.1 hypothetical protein I303_01217 [Kwoniella dejecticola CBS 10117]
MSGGGPSRGRGRGSGSSSARGSAVPRIIEDRDVLGYANKKVANLGPPSIQTFSKVPVPFPPVRGRGGIPPVRGSRGGGGGSSVPRGSGLGRGRGSAPSTSSRDGYIPGPNNGLLGRPFEADTYRPRYNANASPAGYAPTGPRDRGGYHERDRDRDRDRDWDRDRERDRDMRAESSHHASRRYHTSSSSPPARNDVRRYSPSYPVRQDTWSPPSRTPRRSSSPIEIDPQEHFGTSTSNQAGITSSRPTSRLTQGSPQQEHDISRSTNRSSSSYTTHPSSTTTRASNDLASNHPPPSGPSSSRPSSPPRTNGVAQTTSIALEKGQNKSATPISQSLIPEPQPPAEIKKMSFKPINPNNPKSKGKEKQNPLAEISVKSEPNPGPGLGPKLGPTNHEPAESYKEEIVEEQIDIKPTVKDLEDEVVTDQGVRTSGTIAFTKQELPDCWSKNVTERGQARMAFRKTQRAEMIRQGKKIGGTHWRDDGVAFDWTLPENPALPTASTSVPPTVALNIQTSTSKPPAALPTPTATPNASGPSPATSTSAVSVAKSASKAAQVPATTPKPAITTGTLTTKSGASAGPPMKSQKAASILGTESSHSKNENAIISVDGKKEAKLVPDDADSLDESQNGDPNCWKLNAFEYHEGFAYPPEIRELTQRRDIVSKKNVKLWIRKVCNLVSRPDERGRPTRWVKQVLLLKPDTYTLVVLSKRKSKSAIEAFEGGPIILDQEVLSDLGERNEQRVVEGENPLKCYSRSNSGSKASSASGTPSSRGSKLATSSNSIALTQSTSSSGTLFSSSQRQKRNKRAREEEMALNSSETPIKDDRSNPSDVSKKAKSSHQIQKTSPNDLCPTGATPNKTTLTKSTPAKNRSPSKPASEPLPPAASTSATQSKPTMAPTKPNSHTVGPPLALPSTAQDGKRPSVVSAPLSTPAPAPTLTPASLPTPAAASTPAHVPASAPAPAPTSGKLESLNTSLRLKVSEIEKWTKLTEEFPDLKIALTEQISKTREEIFRLYDDIASEKGNPAT